MLIGIIMQTTWTNSITRLNPSIRPSPKVSKNPPQKFTTKLKYQMLNGGMRRFRKIEIYYYRQSQTLKKTKTQPNCTSNLKMLIRSTANQFVEVKLDLIRTSVHHEIRLNRPNSSSSCKIRYTAFGSAVQV